MSLLKEILFEEQKEMDFGGSAKKNIDKAIPAGAKRGLVLTGHHMDKPRQKLKVRGAEAFKIRNIIYDHIQDQCTEQHCPAFSMFWHDKDLVDKIVAYGKTTGTHAAFKKTFPGEHDRYYAEKILATASNKGAYDYWTAKKAMEQ